MITITRIRYPMNTNNDDLIREFIKKENVEVANKTLRTSEGTREWWFVGHYPMNTLPTLHTKQMGEAEVTAGRLNEWDVYMRVRTMQELSGIWGTLNYIIMDHTFSDKDRHQACLLLEEYIMKWKSTRTFQSKRARIVYHVNILLRAGWRETSSIIRSIINSDIY